MPEDKPRRRAKTEEDVAIDEAQAQELREADADIGAVLASEAPTDEPSHATEPRADEAHPAPKGKTAAAGRNRRREFFDHFTGLKIEKPIELGSRALATLALRDFKQISRDGYVSLVVGRSQLDTEIATEIEREINKYLERVESRLKNSEGRIQKLLQNENIGVEAKFSKNRVMTVPVLTPVCNRFIRILQTADRTLALLGTAYIEGLIDGATHAKESYNVKRSAVGVATAMRNFRSGVLKRINLAGKGRLPEDVDGELGEEVHQAAAAIAESPTAAATA
ncbi:MAG: hypothetical protein ACK50G_01250 [bacterium]